LGFRRTQIGHARELTVVDISGKQLLNLPARTAFIPCHEIDDVCFDKPSYLAPDKMGLDAFVLLRTA
jgi:non-homologous end joining protein Ku